MMFRTCCGLVVAVCAAPALAQSAATGKLSSAPSQWIEVSSAPGGEELSLTLQTDGSAVTGVAHERKGARTYVVAGRLTQTTLTLMLQEAKGWRADCAYSLQPTSGGGYAGDRVCSGKTVKVNLLPVSAGR